MPTRRSLLLLLVCCAVGVTVAGGLGSTYTARMSSTTGFFRVRVADAVGEHPGLRRPRQTTVVVVDGLGYLDAQTMRSTARLQARGQCRKTYVGSMSLSRPVYASLSTGLEADRTGVRFNDHPEPLTAPSIWEVARAGGLTVAGVSELDWWRELFPRGFDDFVVGEKREDFFAMAPAADVRLVHPLYVDEAGHYEGASSAGYKAAVARVDEQLGRFLDTVDFDLDMVVVTADHGHSRRGGHVGQQDRVAHVLTCYAGRGVRMVGEPGGLRSTTIGPSLALLLGLPFPAEMRADAALDELWEIVDPAAFPAEYVAERRAAATRIIKEQAAQLRAWLPASEGEWDKFYAWHRERQLLTGVPFAGLIALVLAIQAGVHRRRAGGRAALFGAAFVGLAAAVAWGLQVGLRGSFDLSSVAYREDFLGFTIVLGLVWSAAAIGGHWLVRRDADALVLDVGVVSAIGTVLCVAHPVVFGYQLGFPVPPAPAFFFPLWAALALGVLNGGGMVMGVVISFVGRGARDSLL
jgi:hypothetical protein